MEEKKYELIPSDKEGLFRVKALRDFSDVKKGDLGGYVSGEDNLSHEGNCWIYDNAIVRGNAGVYGNARTFGNADVRAHARVYGNAVVRGNAWVSGNAVVRENAIVFDNAVVCEHAIVFGDAEVFGYTRVSGYAQIYGKSMVCGHALVCDNAVVRGNAGVLGYAEICGDAVIKGMGDYMVYQNTWSSGRFFTWTRSNNMWKVGCFYGTGNELIKKAYKDSELSGKMYEIYVNLVKKVLKTYQKLAENK